MEAKYEIVEDDYIDLLYDDITYRLYRIRATEDFRNESYYITIRKGDLGGYITPYVDIDAGSWVDKNAKVIATNYSYQISYILGNTIVTGNALVVNSRLNKCYVDGDAEIVSSAIEDGRVTGFATVKNSSIANGLYIDGFCQINNSNINGRLSLKKNVIIDDCYFKQPEPFGLSGDFSVVHLGENNLIKIATPRRTITTLRTSEGDLMVSFGNMEFVKISGEYKEKLTTLFDYILETEGVAI